MTMRNETSPTEVPDALSVVLSSNSTSEQASGTFSGLREVGFSMGQVSPLNEIRVENASEAQDGAPVAGGFNWFHVAGLAAVAEGHISEEGLERVMHALYGGAK
jgi:hypothetical protein